MTWLRNERSIIVFLLIMIFIFSLVVVTVKNQNRIAFVESEVLQHERDILESEWSRLQAENSTLRMPGYVEKSVAELEMIYPHKEIPIIVQ